MAWGAIASAGLSIVGGLFGSSSAERRERENRIKRDHYTGLYEENLDELEVFQTEERLITESQNEIELAKFKRGAARQASQSLAATEAAAYIGGVSNSSSMQGYMGGFSLDTLSALNDVTFNYNLNLLNSERAQEASLLNREMNFNISQANMYGAALQQSQADASIAQSQIWAGAGQLAGSLASKFWF